MKKKQFTLDNHFIYRKPSRQKSVVISAGMRNVDNIIITLQVSPVNIFNLTNPIA